MGAVEQVWHNQASLELRHRSQVRGRKHVNRVFPRSSHPTWSLTMLSGTYATRIGKIRAILIGSSGTQRICSQLLDVAREHEVEVEPNDLRGRYAVKTGYTSERPACAPRFPVHMRRRQMKFHSAGTCSTSTSQDQPRAPFSCEAP